MQIYSDQNVEWSQHDWGRLASVAPLTTWQEVSPQRSFGPENLEKGQELLVVTLAGGAQLRLSDRVFRPLAGQVLQRESGEELEIVNDTLQPLRILRIQLPAQS